MTPAQEPIEYRSIPNIPGYRIGNDGSIWTCKKKGGNDRTPGQLSETWKRLKTHRDTRGYLRVNLDNHGVNHHRLVHQLVLETFIGPRPEGYEACHYPDPEKTNNALSNLRWDTHKENGKDRYRAKLGLDKKMCSSCRIHKTLDAFYTDKRTFDGRKQACKQCHNRQRRH